jgi:GNAT superfamily N-acetyltransferase
MSTPAVPPDVDTFRPPDAGWVVARHAALYAAENGFDDSFGRTVAGILAGFVANHDPQRERGWIAWQDGTRCGSVFCMAEDAATARLRLFLVEPGLRGTGLAPRMLTTCLGFARAAGYQRLVLSTHESHRAACRLYARSGFALDRAEPVRAYGHDLVAQHWSITL